MIAYQEFKREEAVEIALRFNIKTRTVGKILKDCLGKFLIQTEYGYYSKITPSK